MKSNSYENTQTFFKSIPFYGTGGELHRNFRRNLFSPGIKVKYHPLFDLSIKKEQNVSQLDYEFNQLRKFLKVGDKIKGIVVNSQVKGKPKYVIGRLFKIKQDVSNNRIRVWIRNQKTLEIFEIYPESIIRINESWILTFEEFINS